MWDIDFQTAVAQAEIEDRLKPGAYHHIRFAVESGDPCVIATTRPELLAACIAVVVHPDDSRYQAMIGKFEITPLFHVRVPIMASTNADPEKGKLGCVSIKELEGWTEGTFVTFDCSSVFREGGIVEGRHPNDSTNCGDCLPGYEDTGENNSCISIEIDIGDTGDTPDDCTKLNRVFERGDHITQSGCGGCLTDYIENEKGNCVVSPEVVSPDNICKEKGMVYLSLIHI